MSTAINRRRPGHFTVFRFADKGHVVPVLYIITCNTTNAADDLAHRRFRIHVAVADLKKRFASKKRHFKIVTDAISQRRNNGPVENDCISDTVSLYMRYGTLMGHLRIFCVEAEVDFEVAKADFEIYENMEDACYDRAARKYSCKKIFGMTHNFIILKKYF